MTISLSLHDVGVKHTYPDDHDNGLTAVVIPLSWSHIPRFTAAAIDLLRIHHPDLQTIYIDADTIGEMRNQGVTRAKETGAVQLLFMDADMTFGGSDDLMPTDPITQLAAPGVPVVGGLCHSRSEPFEATQWGTPGADEGMQRLSGPGGGG